MSARHCRWIVPSVLALAVTSAFAGQITLYENPDFLGRYVVSNDGAAIVARVGFGDAASSIVVTDGTWEACSEAHFRGRCAQLAPGNYPRIDVTLNGRIASVRQVGYASPVPVAAVPQTIVATPAPIVVSVPQVVVIPAPVMSSAQPVAVNPAPVLVYTAPSVAASAQPVVVTASPVVSAVPSSFGRAVLYENPNFGGARVTIDRGQAKDLEWAHFTNPAHRATSIRVESGEWLFCSEMGFQGECRVLGPGEYPQLTGPLVAGISSARQVWYPEYGALTVYRR
jgi:hypothetical protein